MAGPLRNGWPGSVYKWPEQGEGIGVWLLIEPEINYISGMNWKERVTYDPVTGDLIWKELPRSLFTSDHQCNARNARFAGKVAGSRPMLNGHRTAILINNNGRTAHAHRVVWEMHFGAIPSGFVVDHVNGDPWDNRLCNLRLATRSQNSANCKTPKHNSSGQKCVYWSSQYGYWYCSVQFKGKRTWLGAYPTKEQAIEAYHAKVGTVHGEFASTR